MIVTRGLGRLKSLLATFGIGRAGAAAAAYGPESPKARWSAALRDATWIASDAQQRATIWSPPPAA